METSTSTTRKIGDTSMDESMGEAKAPKIAEEPPASPTEDMPRYATLLLNMMTELKTEVAEVKVVISGVVNEMKEVRGELEVTSAKMYDMCKKMEALEERVEMGEAKQSSLEMELAEVKLENQELRSKFLDVRGDLDEQIDRGLRDHLTFYGLTGSDKKWGETAERLAGWLSVNLGGSVAEWDNAIYRAHRGPYNPDKPGPRPIFCHMNDRKVQQIKDKMKFQAINGVSISDQMSKNTQQRVNEALIYRKHLKSLPENAGAKIFVAYPANVKIKRTTDSNYHIERRF